MKLTRNTEWALIAALIVYISFSSGFRSVKDILATPLGKAAGLAVIVYVWKFVSAPVALLLAISFMRCAKWNVWEMFSGAEQSCTCETPDAVWDVQSKTCKDASGMPAGPVKTCSCANGYAWDGGEKGTKQCIPVSGTQPPVPPPAEMPAMPPAPLPPAPIVPPPEEKTETGETKGETTKSETKAEGFVGGMGSSLGSAPLTGGVRAPSEVPQTTGSAGASLLRDGFLPPSLYGGVQPGSGARSGPASA
jgi:hypothetical protein